MFEAFDRIYIINLPSREDRRREMEQQVDRWSLARSSEVKFFDGIRPDDAGPFLRVGAHGVFLSFLEILQAEIDTGRRILVLEDDCSFTSNCLSPIGTGWDIFYGGFTASDPNALERSDIVGAHCMGFSPSAIEALAGYLQSEYANAPVRGEHVAPIDGAIVNFRRANPSIASKFKKVSYQRSSRTDIGEPSLIDRFPQFARAIRGIRNRIRL